MATCLCTYHVPRSPPRDRSSLELSKGLIFHWWCFDVRYEEAIEKLIAIEEMVEGIPAFQLRIRSHLCHSYTEVCIIIATSHPCFAELLCGGVAACC